MQADTKLIGFWSVLTFMVLGPFIAPVYAAYSFGYWMRDRGWWIFYPYAVAFAVVNTLHNWTVCTILFRELPREFFTTQRLKRWKNSEDVQRRELADMIGGFLNRHDEGHY